MEKCKCGECEAKTPPKTGNLIANMQKLVDELEKTPPPLAAAPLVVHPLPEFEAKYLTLDTQVKLATQYKTTSGVVALSHGEDAEGEYSIYERVQVFFLTDGCPKSKMEETAKLLCEQVNDMAANGDLFGNLCHLSWIEAVPDNFEERVILFLAPMVRSSRCEHYQALLGPTPYHYDGKRYDDLE